MNVGSRSLRPGRVMTAALLALTLGGNALAETPVKNVVLVHGGFVDGSGWRGVYDILKKDGYKVSVVQNPTISLAGPSSPTMTS